MSKKDKKKRTKYIDDGRTIADMSFTGRSNDPLNQKTGCRAQLETYFNTVKMMVLPMLVVMGIITVAFLIMYFLL